MAAVLKSPDMEGLTESLLGSQQRIKSSNCVQLDLVLIKTFDQSPNANSNSTSYYPFKVGTAILHFIQSSCVCSQYIV